MLSELEALPDGFLDVEPEELHRLLPGPSLIHLAGERPRPLFVSIMLHGNEDAGLGAVQRLLRRFATRPLPRAMSLFVGNVAAARFGLRRLDGQPDYNRVWPGGEAPPSPESEMMARVLETMRARDVFASVDVHNNTGVNPHYACVNRLHHASLHLAALFGRTVVYFIRPRGVQSMAFAELCPAVTLECGKAGEPLGEEHAAEFLEACLRLSEFPAHPVAPHDIDLFHTVAVVKVPDGQPFAFGCETGPLCFPGDLDHMNFRELEADTPLARVEGESIPLTAEDEWGRSVVERYFRLENGWLILTRPVMPSMLTLDERVVRQDCLCYLMERLEVPGESGEA